MKRLDEARQQHSRGDYTRRLLLDALNGFDRDPLGARLQKLEGEMAGARRELSALRAQLATAVHALLLATTSGERLTPEQAAAWVEECFRGEK